MAPMMLQDMLVAGMLRSILHCRPASQEGASKPRLVLASAWVRIRVLLVHRLARGETVVASGTVLLKELANAP